VAAHKLIRLSLDSVAYFSYKMLKMGCVKAVKFAGICRDGEKNKRPGLQAVPQKLIGFLPENDQMSAVLLIGK
jgi:hypothetical protein